MKFKLKRGYSIDCSVEEHLVVGVQVLGNYSKSKYRGTDIVSKYGISPTIRENHGQVIGIIVGKGKE